ncbi:MAG: hypothetical protein ACK5W0_11905, partial [Labrys sp. (in: a-proteobacteria)]
NSISAILSSVIVVFLVRFSFANRTLREDRRWPPRGVRSYTTPRDVTDDSVARQDLDGLNSRAIARTARLFVGLSALVQSQDEAKSN